MLEGLRVLVVDDGRDAADSLGDLLRLRGAEARVAYSGPEALDVLDGWIPVVVLLDLGMPGMDGYRLAREIRARPALDDVALVALSGWTPGVDPRAAREAGFERLLLKPAEMPALEALLVQLASRETRAPRPDDGGAP
jgi:CheY-like chemotaxis protein